MKVTVKKFNTHQTAKVFAIIVAFSMLLFMVPFSLIALLAPGPADADGNAVSFTPFFIMFLIMPLFQGGMFYIFMRFGMWVYNKFYSTLGGIEFEFESIEDDKA